MIPLDYSQLGFWNRPSNMDELYPGHSLSGGVAHQDPSFNSPATSSLLSQEQIDQALKYNSLLDMQVPLNFSEFSNGPSLASGSASPSPSPSFSSSLSPSPSPSPSVASSAGISKSGSDAPSGVSSERSSSSVGSNGQNAIVPSSAHGSMLYLGSLHCLVPVQAGVLSGQPSGMLPNISNGPASSPKLSSSSSSAASSAVSSSETGGAGAQRIPKKITKKKKRNTNNPQFPDLKYFHPYFETFYPIKSEIKYLNDKRIIDNGIIEEIWRGPSGVPLVRIGEQWVEFRHLYVRDLKRGNSAMIFTKGCTKHVAADVTELKVKIVKGVFIREYTMKNSNSCDIDYINIDGSQIYRVIPITIDNRKSLHAVKVKLALNEIWTQFNRINEDD